MAFLVIRKAGRIAAATLIVAAAELATGWPPARAESAAPDLSRAVGRMIMVGFRGTAPSDPDVSAVTDAIRRGHLGGVLFLRRNVISQSQVKALTAHFRDAAGDRPLLIALDQEGGRIERLTTEAGFRERPSAEEVARMPTGAARRLYEKMARDLKEWGFNVNFGPVLDLAVNPDNPIIARYGRAYSADPRRVAAYGRAFVEAHRAAGLVTSVKHFPGHGSSSRDSHVGFVDISATWSQKELKPYLLLDRHGAIDSVMVGHLFLDRYGCAGEVPLPASLCRGIVDGLMRDILGSRTVAISDDLDMGAVRNSFGFAESLVLAVDAGNDVLIHSNTELDAPDLAGQIMDALLTAAVRDEELRDRIAAANRRLDGLIGRLEALSGR